MQLVLNPICLVFLISHLGLVSQVALQSMPKQGCTNNNVGSATGDSAFKCSESCDDMVSERFQSEGLLRQVDVSAEAVCKYIDFNITCGGWNVNEAQPEGILGS